MLGREADDPCWGPAGIPDPRAWLLVASTGHGTSTGRWDSLGRDSLGRDPFPEAWGLMGGGGLSCGARVGAF